MAARGFRFPAASPAALAGADVVIGWKPPWNRRRLQFAAPRHRVLNLGGPESKDMADFAREWQRATGVKGQLVRLPLPGAMGRYLREGLNLVPEARHGNEIFRGWLENSADSL